MCTKVEYVYERITKRLVCLSQDYRDTFSCHDGTLWYHLFSNVRSVATEICQCLVNHCICYYTKSAIDSTAFYMCLLLQLIFTDSTHMCPPPHVGLFWIDSDSSSIVALYVKLICFLPSRAEFICTCSRSESESCAANALKTVACISLFLSSSARAVRPCRLNAALSVTISVYSPSPLNVYSFPSSVLM